MLWLVNSLDEACNAYRYSGQIHTQHHVFTDNGHPSNIYTQCSTVMCTT